MNFIMKINESNSCKIDISLHLLRSKGKGRLLQTYIYCLSVCEFRMKGEEIKDGVIPVHFRFRLMFLINEYALYT